MRQEENTGGRKSEKKPLSFANIAKYVVIGLEFPSTIIGGLLLGYLIDLSFGTSPWFMMMMVFLAFLGAVFRLVQWLQRSSGDRA